MSIVSLNVNAAALSVQNKLERSTKALGDSISRLSSGLRITKASDDAAGLALAESLNVDAKVFNQAIRNINDGISLLNVAESALVEQKNILMRLQELAQQASNGVLSRDQRAALDQEREALAAEYDRIMASAEFNGMKLLDASADEIKIQAGYGADSAIALVVDEYIKRRANDGTFAAPTTYTMSSAEHSALAVGDFNEDGVNDVAIGPWGAVNTAVNIGNGDGTFQAPQYYDDGDVSSFRQLDAYDMNNDGHLDLVGFCESADSVVVSLGSGDGTFQAGIKTAIGFSVESWSTFGVGDFNGDSVLDVAFTGDAADKIGVLLGNGSGGFTAQSQSTSAVWDLVTAADINEDGLADLVGTGPAATMWYAFSLGNGSFTAPAAVAGVPNGFPNFADMNNDGHLDLVDAGASTTIHWGDGTGTFTAGPTLAGTDHYHAATADLNDDGLLDVISTEVGGEIDIFLNNGDNTFSGPTSQALGGYWHKPEVADMNGDGAVDIVQALGAANQTGILFGNGEIETTLPAFSVSTQEAARDALELLEDVSAKVSLQLGAIGAFQSRLSSAASNAEQAEVNFREARSRIMDADIALETAEVVKQQIIQNLGTSILAQANQAPAIALKLLQIK